jgi:DNA-binding NarL/FixJ family response regulator
MDPAEMKQSISLVGCRRERTVENHIHNALNAPRLRNRVQLARWTAEQTTA